MTSDIHKDAYELLKAATGDFAEFEERDGKKYARICVKAAYAALSQALRERDEARAQVANLYATQGEEIALIAVARECEQAEIIALRSLLKEAGEVLGSIADIVKEYQHLSGAHGIPIANLYLRPTITLHAKIKEAGL